MLYSILEDGVNSELPFKRILLWNNAHSWGFNQETDVFIEQQCPINTCSIASNKSNFLESDLVLFKNSFDKPHIQRPANQIWVMYLLESPPNTRSIKEKDIFNWSATYRTDSTLVAPYERWQYYDEGIQQLPINKNYAAGKTKGVAWFVSNCNTKNGRLEYAKELEKFIEVDIYGECGSHKCSRSMENDCFQMLDENYRFYLSFENSNCKNYITEKFFVNGLGHDIIPIVMGARPKDYKKVAPYNSYIHVDDFDGPKELAEYLKVLENDDDLYNNYFRWKGTGEMINTKFWCRVCSLLHYPRSYYQNRYYKDFNEWWKGEGTCVSGRWNKTI